MQVNPRDIHALKPKKDGSTYFAQLLHKKKEIRFTLDNAQVFPQASSSSQILVKHKQMCMYMADLNDHIINVVKDHCEAWFNNNMDIELIEDYYVNPVKFHKVHGNVIKVKLANGSVAFPEKDSIKANVVIVLKGLRFLKQKFSLEWEVREWSPSIANDIEFDLLESDDLSTSEDEDEDLPEPIPDDVDEIKTNLLAQLASVHGKLTKKIETLSGVASEVKTYLEEIRTADDLATFTRIQDIMDSNEIFYVNNI
jgi:hypothetical protein